MSLAERAAFGAKWSVVSLTGRRLVTIGASVVLARLLSPADFGVMAMAVVFIGLVELMREIGTGAAIVQADDPGELFLSSLFWLNAAIGAGAGAALAAAAPFAALAFREPRLTPVLQVMALSPLCAAVTVVPAALLTRAMQFKRLAVAEVGGAVAGGVAGILLALNGYGVWSLVWQTIVSTGAIAVAVLGACGWRPRAAFRLHAIRPVIGYSAGLTGYSILTYVVRNADNVLIGRYLGVQSLGLYDLAFRVMMSSLQVVSAALHRALFPVYTRFGGDYRRLGSAYLRVTAGIALIVFPIIVGIGAVADALVAAAFGGAWVGAVPLLRILAPLGALQALSTSVINIYQTVGRTGTLFWWTAVSGALLVIAFAIGLRWGVDGVAASYAIVSFVLAYPSFRIPLAMIDLPVSSLLGAIGRPAASSAAMLGVVLGLRYVFLAGSPPAVVLGVAVPAGAAVYAGLVWMFNRQNASDLARLAAGA